MRADFCEVLRGGRQKIYRLGVKGVSRDLLIGYEHCLIADHSTLSLTLGTNSNPFGQSSKCLILILTLIPFLQSIAW